MNQMIYKLWMPQFKGKQQSINILHWAVKGYEYLIPENIIKYHVVECSKFGISNSD